uniref:Large ribosomal subunit protein uL23c n=1 Tax=Chlorokybus atmophyticus TaxID=3144 RepID=Q19VA7_CHLAT|nr:ribosomal protein L23 [Chlorokybus atmophyticus]ABD62234.2 ribosomal protein L23 [Chlorokybus atmophyticus]WKT05669.1 ribosomal protein L23 [Chlorokybus atmophyticus]
MIDLVKYPVLTEKATRLLDNNQYTFDVDPKATKVTIKALIENLFQVKVVSVNTHIPPRKRRRIGRSQGYRTQYKRVIVTLKTGDSIQLFPET